MEKCTKSLNRIKVLTINCKNNNLQFKMNPFIDGEITEISIRLADIMTIFHPNQKKDELIKILKRLKEVKKEMDKEVEKFENTQKQGIKPNTSIVDHSFVLGRFVSLIKITNFLLQRIRDIEENNKFTEEDEKIMEESKKNQDLSYVG